MPKFIAGSVIALLCLMLHVSTGLAETTIIDAPTAHQMQQDGSVTLIDIRRPSEWRDTGIAQGARTITMHDPDHRQMRSAQRLSRRIDSYHLCCPCNPSDRRRLVDQPDAHEVNVFDLNTGGTEGSDVFLSKYEFAR